MVNYLLAQDEQRELAKGARDILDAQLAPRVLELDKSGTFPLDVFHVLADAGYHGLDIPEKWGGLGLDKKTACLVYEEMAKVDGGFSLSFAISAKQWTKVAATHWSDDEKRAFIEKIIAGEKIGAFCLTEPDAGSDASACTANAVQDGDDWIINGRKTFITNGPIADYFLVIVWTDKSKSSGKGMTQFFVDAKTPGVSIGKAEDKMGLRLSATSDVIFEDVRVPSKNVVGDIGKGLVFGMQELAAARITNMCHVLGIAQAALDYAVDFSKVRKTFGKRIADHQGFGFMLADMQFKLDAARALLYYGLDCAAAGLDVGTLSPSAKVVCSENAMAICLDAIQALGGYGYMREYPVEKLARDAKSFAIFEGTNQIQRMTCAKLLVGKSPKT